MTVSYGKLVDAAMAMRAYAPAEWDNFVAAVQEYSANVLAETLRSPPELLHRAQGMAIQACEFSNVMRDAPKLHEKRLQETMGRRNG